MLAGSRSPILGMLLLPMAVILSLSFTTTLGFVVTTPSSSSTTTTTKSMQSTKTRQYDRYHSDIFQLYDQKEAASETFRAEAESLREKAEKLRAEIEENSSQKTRTATASASTATESLESSAPLNPWAIVSSEPKEEGDREFRLYADVGREEGTWMDPRWGASGKRIEFSLDVRLLSNRLATPEVAKKMVQDNTAGKSSQVFALETAEFARLRDGFDRMECTGGAYRIDTDRNGRSTIRIVIEVEGTTRADQSYVYGDVSVPPGCLYFSLPCFGRGIDNLSIKEGVVSVRQVGWHTGWRREESRILGVFTAKPLPEATKKDRF